jgi:hypothetical protein
MMQYLVDVSLMLFVAAEEKVRQHGVRCVYVEKTSERRWEASEARNVGQLNPDFGSNI